MISVINNAEKEQKQKIANLLMEMKQAYSALIGTVGITRVACNGRRQVQFKNAPPEI